MKAIKGFLKAVSYLCAGIIALMALIVFSPKARDKILAWAEKFLDKLDRLVKPKLADDDDELNMRAEEYVRGLEREYYPLNEDDFYDDDLD